jgi:hypothetical protein
MSGGGGENGALTASTMMQSRHHISQNVFGDMHDVSRHAIHVSEVLQATVESMIQMQQYRKDIYETLPIDLGTEYKKQATSHMDFQIQLVRSLKLRADSSDKRLEHEVGLVLTALPLPTSTLRLGADLS